MIECEPADREVERGLGRIVGVHDEMSVGALNCSDLEALRIRFPFPCGAAVA